MKNYLLSVFLLVVIFACDRGYAPGKRDAVFLNRRDFIAADTSIIVKPVFIPLPAGAVYPQGWVKDWAESAADGITGHLDEWTATYGMAWKGIGFAATGTDSATGTGWALEQSSYWLDGAVRLAYILNDGALIDKVSARLDTVVNGVLNGGKSFVYWKDDMDFKNDHFDNWAHSHMGRALVAYYEATGEERILEALTKVYGQFDVLPVPFQTYGVSGCTNIDPMLSVYELSGDGKVLESIRGIARDSLTVNTVNRWNHEDFYSGHGVVTYENIRIPAMMYSVTGRHELLSASKNYIQWLDENHLLPYDIASSEEFVAGKGSTRNTETCNVACSGWTYQQLLEITGEGAWGDRIEKVFFNAGPAPVSRDFKTMSYYQSPNRIDTVMPSEIPGHPGEGAYNYKNTGHEVLCCVGNLNRVIPNYVMHMWMGTADNGLAAALYGPSVVNAVAGKNIPVKITSETNYPFGETVAITVEPAKRSAFPIYLRIPSWCCNPSIKVNDEPVIIDNNINGFFKINRMWERDDRIALSFPMQVEITDGKETPYPSIGYYVHGTSAKRVLPKEKNINSPYRTVSYGPLLFALAIKDISPNEQSPDGKWNYALLSDNGNEVEVERSPMPDVWRWQIDDAPVRLKVKAGEFDWHPTHVLPLPAAEVETGGDEYITLVPYGCTKFRISMFPVAKK
ncbi:MAG: glycoside hydrolase family 127 protein [Dysgonamonadaceae bacterium]|jgi:hypothetical protein|nr:glycoside hydrolase family 127 protein [Dysgonamonadaceae bacterium]